MTEANSWCEILRNGAAILRAAKRAQKKLIDWFLVQEIKMQEREAMLANGQVVESPMGQAELLCRVVQRIPLWIMPGSAIAGSQDGAFSPSYALINPAFRVETFSGYCNPTAIYNDISANSEQGITAERIQTVQNYWEHIPYVKALKAAYIEVADETAEVVYFMEPVTGHTIPDLQPFLANGVCEMQRRAMASGTQYGLAMARSLEAALILALRYRTLADEMANSSDDVEEQARLRAIAEILARVPAGGAKTLQEAVQMFVLLWQTMVLEQAPNPYAFSAGNIDRVLVPYYDMGGESREEAVELLRHVLCFFQVGSRCWAISQNVIVGGRNEDGKDLTCEMTRVALDAFFDTNDPQPALSVKVHAGTPEEFYRSLGRFFFTPGHSTPSVFNDDAMFEMLRCQGIAESDLPNYGIAGCQEPLIMGKASLNTTNTWLNLAKVLELACNDGRSLITGKKIGPSWQELGCDGEEHVYANLEEVFFKTLGHFLPRMGDAGNACTRLLGEYNPVPFTSSLMDSFESWRDMRDREVPGTRYHASGCLIHGLSVVADSLHAVQRALKSGMWTATEIRNALQDNFQTSGEIHHFLASQPKYGNNHAEVDEVAVGIVGRVSELVGNLKNAAGNKYLADWSTPSTHLLYGYWVGATPDGRIARAMLGYGLDPRPEVTPNNLPERMLSAWKLPYRKMTGGYASHIGVGPERAKEVGTLEEKGLWIRDRVIAPLFRFPDGGADSPFYVYFNVDTSVHLRRVLENPSKYAPSGIYIMRIHGTFVNFLDLSPAIQEDILQRLDAGNTTPCTAV